MKKIFKTLAAVVCCTMTIVVLTACSSDNTDTPATEPEQGSLGEYTIMFYSAGADDIDAAMLSLANTFYNANPEAYKKVNVVIQFKYSTVENLSNSPMAAIMDSDFCTTFGSKTLRWAVDPAKKFEEDAFVPENIYGADNADITCPDSLTNFINWAAQKYPAKKYMLIIADHGGGYFPLSDLPKTESARTTRVLLRDDGNNKTFNVWSLSQGIKNANVRLQTVFMLACMMNNMEYQFELKDLCDYVIASTYTMPSKGSALNELPELLSQPNVDIEKALDTFCKDDVKSWESDVVNPDSTVSYTDLTLTRTANINKLGTMMCQFVDRLCDTYTKGTEAQKHAIDSCTARAVKVQENYPYYDVAKYMSSIMSALPEVYDISFYNQMEDAFNSCIVAQHYSSYLTAHHYMVDYSVILGTDGAFNYIMWNKDQETGAMTPTSGLLFTDDGEKYQFALVPTDNPQSYKMENIMLLDNWGGTLDNTYGQLAFDKAVGWSRWLRLNCQWPNIFCPSGLKFELPSADASSQDK